MGALVRNGLADPAPMTDKLLAAVVARAAGHFSRKRSDAYRWLLAHHGDLAAVFAKHPACWPDVAATMAAAGVLGGRGRPLTGQAVRRIWGRVCRDVQAAATFQAAGVRPGAGATRPPMPSSALPGWRPIPVAPPPAPGTPADADAEAEAEAERQLARLRRHIDERSGRKRVGTSAEIPAETAPVAASLNPLDLPKEGGPLTPEQVRAMKASLQRTLDERSGRLPPSW